MNITLIGMPGSGKSFIGKKLADQFSFSFIDIDKIIEQEFGLPLQKVVEKLGNKAFLDKEAQTTIESTDAQDNLAVSTGGSIIYRTDAMDHLKKISKIFYLEVPLKILEERIGNIPRGIVIPEGKTFTDLYAERTLLYREFADYILEGDADSEIIVKAILSALDQKPHETIASLTKIP